MTDAGASRQGLTLDALNTMPRADFAARLDGVFEEADWVAQRTAAQRPFATLADLHTCLMETVRAADPATQLEFLRGHPELGASGAMAPLSVVEQASLGLSGEDSLAALNQAYRARFGFPFILCVRRHTRASLLDNFRRRLSENASTEHATALEEVGHITWIRLQERVGAA